MYKLVMLQTPDVNGLAELEIQVSRLVNEAIEREKDWTLIGLELHPLAGGAIYNIALHFSETNCPACYGSTEKTEAHA